MQSLVVGMLVVTPLLLVYILWPRPRRGGAITINTGPKVDLGSYNTKVKKGTERDAWSQ